VFPPAPAERFLICSDGLSLEVEDAEIEEILSRPESAQQLADALVARALAAGGRDNVTVIVVDLGSAGESDAGVNGDTAPRPRLEVP
jgi:serine/threonine protein phosphatase PrpC